MKLFVLASAAISSIIPITAVAKEKPPVFVEAKIVKDAPVVVLDPAKAYVLLRTPGAIPVSFSKVPTEDDRLAYERLKAAAYTDAREDYT